MRIIRVKDYDELSARVADLIIAQVVLSPKSVLGLATGSTPVGAYKVIVETHKKGQVDFSEITTVNLDEYCGLAPDNDQSYRYFMNENLFNHVNVNKARTYVPSGLAADYEKESDDYENLISNLGGIDLQLLGLGHNGHIGFNEPCDEFFVKTHRVLLTKETIDANSRFFDNYDDVPKSAITMGMGAIMRAKRIVLAVSGSQKTEILKKAIFGKVTPQVPASVLQLHNDLIVVTDCL